MGENHHRRPRPPSSGREDLAGLDLKDRTRGELSRGPDGAGPLTPFSRETLPTTRVFYALR